MQRFSKPFIAFILLFSLHSTAYSIPGDVLESFTILNETGDGRVPITPQGITYHDGLLYIVDFATDRIYRTYPSQVLDTDEVTILFSQGDSDLNIPLQDADNPPINSDGSAIPSCGSATPAGQFCGGGGLTFAKNFLWNASPITDNIIKIDPVDGDNLESENVLASLAFPSPTDMTYDGTSFWVVDWQTNTINKVSPEDGSIIATIPGPSTKPTYATDPGTGPYNAKPFGITWDGQALWVSDQSEEKIYRINPVDGSLLNYFNSPGSSPKGLAWDGEFLWHVDQGTNTIYKLESGVIPFGLIGCIEKNGIGVNGDVLLSQTAIPDQSATTSSDGCFIFPTFTSGVPIQVQVSESGVDEKPVLTLLESSPGVTDVILAVGDTYTDPGVSAIDAEDGDISINVVASPDVINTPGLIDTSAPTTGDGYTITYNVVDSAGNLADPVTRQVKVLEADTTAPVITLLGDNPQHVEQASSYVEAGATAADDRDGNISADITVTGTVNANIAGTYTLDYNVSDAAGNAAATVTRTVNVSDTTAPTITLTGSNPITIEKGDTFTDPGATATDNIDGDISASITTTGSVISNTTGTYFVVYNVSDSAGNTAATLTRTVIVSDTTAPVLTLIGASPLNHELNTPFTDPGASAIDTPSEDISSSIVVTGTVDPNTANTYSLTYNVSDSSGNAATSVTRQVIVADTGAPTITLLGDNPLAHELGNIFTDPGATALDAIDGDLTASILVSGDTVNPNLSGTYNINYNVADSANNNAPTQTRTVTVSDTTPPTLTLLGSANIQHDLGTVYTDAGATASDNTDGDITANIIVGGDTVDTNTIGVYTITYNVSDAAGNPGAPITRVVDVADRTAPVISIIGASPLDHEVGTIFVDPGATASDNIDGNVSSRINVTGTVNPNVIGAYTLSYNVTDIAGNSATTATRTVNVVDTGAPSITLLGDSPILHELQTTFTDPGATAFDAADGDLTASIIVTGTVDSNIAGTYTLSYNVTDSQSNAAATVNRNVIVADRTAPTITLTGNSTVNVEQGSIYTDAGATAADLIDGDISANVITGGTVDTNVSGTYTLTYNVNDASGNAATQVTRTVIVSDTTKPVITLTGGSPLNHEVGTIFTDPGATASDNIDGDISSNIGVSGSVNANTIGSYTLSYNVSDSAGNSATTATRTVNVVDTGAPSITLLGDSPILHELQTTFTDPGATAFDAADGDLTASIIVTGTVDSNIAGTYTLSYNVTDSQSNAAATVNRNVIVADRTAPTITLTGNSTVNVEQGSIYTDAGATAADLIDGDISANVTADISAVDTSTIGSYTVTYSVSDAAGNPASATRTVNVVSPPDTTPPVITLFGGSNVSVTQGNAYNEPGYSATDNKDGTITGLVTVDSSALDTNTLGSYNIIYSITDQAGNTATATRSVTVVAASDTTVPTITLQGANPLQLTINDTYVEPGYTAADNVDGDITANVNTDTSALNTSVIGNYLVAYSVSDSSGNTATATRTVQVVAAPDTTPPVITLFGGSNVDVAQGSTYNEPGYSATDNADGTITGLVTVDASSLDTNILGVYTITYSVSDTAGNAANASRTVTVTSAPDLAPPSITLIGDNPLNLIIGENYIEPGYTATDAVDGDLTSSVNVNSSSVNTNVIGSYSVIYSVSDTAGNNASVTRIVKVANAPDTTPPVITLLGNNSIELVQGNAYSEPGYTATDNIDGIITANVITDFSAVNVTIPGSYPIYYNVSDQAGNAAVTVTRTLIVKAAPDTTAPVITLLGDNPLAIITGNAYVEQGASASDNVDGDISNTITINASSVNTNAVGNYTVSYTVSDSSNNSVTEYRTVNVLPLPDTTAPILTLIGDDPQSIIMGYPYVELGAQALDNIDGDITPNISIDASNVNTSIAGTYAVTYNVSDNAGNAANTVSRTVNIIPLSKTFTASPGMSVGSSSATTTMTVGDDRQISDLNVFIDLPHGRPGDLVITLTSPSGTSVVLMDRPGTTGSFLDFGCTRDNINATFDDEGSSVVENMCNSSSPGIGGTVIPHNPLNAFDGESSQGVWTLNVQDKATISNTGSLNSWSLETIIQ